MAGKKSLKWNYLFNMMYQVLIIILPIITTPYISRVLNPAGIGAYNYSYSVASLFVLIANLGTSIYAQREIAFCQNNIVKRSIIFWEMLIIRCSMSVLISPVYIFLSISIKEYKMLLLVQYLLIIATAIDISWLFQGMEDFKKTAFRNISVKMISVLFVFLLVKEENDISLYAGIIAASAVISSLILWFYIKNIICIVSLKNLKPIHHIKPVLLLFLPVAAVYVYTSVDKIVLGLISSQDQVGYYSQSEKIVKLSMTVITSLGTVMLPHIAGLIQQNKTKLVVKQVRKSIHFVLYLGFPMTAGLIAVSPLFVPWFLGSNYEPCILLMQWLALLIVIIGVSSVTGQAVLIPLNKQFIYTFSIITGALFNIICNFILIPKFQALGAVISTIGAEFIVGLMQQYTVLRELKIKPIYLIKDCIKPLIAAFIMLILTCLLTNRLLASTMNVVCVVIFGFFIYFLMLFIFQDAYTLDCTRRILAKLKWIQE